MKNSLK